VPAPLPQASAELPGVPEADDWTALSAQPLAPDAAMSWAVRPDCGGVVVFVGTVRDHSEGRAGVSELVYEAYERAASERLSSLVGEARRRWVTLGRILVWHRTGALGVTDVAVVVAVSAPHRGVAFEAAQWLIDTVKDTVPIWKRETWSEGQGWGTDARPVADLTVRAS
jgi:molybdopterin synthase catalytic subunit